MVAMVRLAYLETLFKEAAAVAFDHLLWWTEQ
jgi:hypothetical protein